MRAAVLRGGHFTVDDIPEPAPGPGQVLVETAACGICGSDLSAYKHTAEFLQASIDSDTPSFIFDPDADLVMGHELSARVVRPGPGVEGFDEGQVVVGLPWALDGGGTLRTIGYSNRFLSPSPSSNARARPGCSTTCSTRCRAAPPSCSSVSA